MPPAPLLDISGFDQTPELSAAEQGALTSLGWHLRRHRSHDATLPEWNIIRRLLLPLDAARFSLRKPTDTPQQRRAELDAIGCILLHCEAEGTTYWGWCKEDWAQLVGDDWRTFKKPWSTWVDVSVRADVFAYGYMICGFDAFHRIGGFNRLTLADRVFGREALETALDCIAAKLEGWGYRSARVPEMRTVVAEILLINRSARVDDLTDDTFALAQASRSKQGRAGRLHAVQRAVAALGFARPPVAPSRTHPVVAEGTTAEWTAWMERWFITSTLAPGARRQFRQVLGITGRWLAAEQPTIVTPADWTRETCAAWVARVMRLSIGDYAHRKVGFGTRTGQPIAPTTKANYISAVRTMLRDCQEWGWCPRRFDPISALATPRSVTGMIGPKPRVIADETWAKLLWSGLNLDSNDLVTAGIHAYPIELVRAIALAWLFAGQRSDEIVRLRVGCIRWQPGKSEGTAEPICLLDLPVHKTGTAFTKPVDPVLGRAIEAWEAVRPTQPPMTDRKTGEKVDLLFACRVIPVARTYINETIIPLLCRKSGQPLSDVRGRITSHRARATIATQLYNAKEPMTLFELQAWLGHRSPKSTQYYAQITPNTLTKAYTDAGYFARNVRTIEVLIDREVIMSGAAARGDPWQHYDLGHGYCSYTFFEQCPHRMACARCDFYIPKPSSRAQLLEAKANVDRRLAMIPLTDGELAAVQEDKQALERLIEGLADKPTPAGPTPRELKELNAARNMP
jgi:integrase